jgi:hypothetical protein
LLSTKATVYGNKRKGMGETERGGGGERVEYWRKEPQIVGVNNRRERGGRERWRKRENKEERERREKETEK